MRTSSTFSILFWIYGKRAINNQTNIYVRITLNGKRINISLKRKIDIDSWDIKKQRLRGKTKTSRTINLYLDEVQSKIYRIYEGLKSEEKPFTPQMIKAQFLGEIKSTLAFWTL